MGRPWINKVHAIGTLDRVREYALMGGNEAIEQEVRRGEAGSGPGVLGHRAGREPCWRDGPRTQLLPHLPPGASVPRTHGQLRWSLYPSTEETEIGTPSVSWLPRAAEGVNSPFYKRPYFKK